MSKGRKYEREWGNPEEVEKEKRSGKVSYQWAIIGSDKDNKSQQNTN
jgi:hypothetical protein